jgi:hypothetical protein
VASDDLLIDSGPIWYARQLEYEPQSLVDGFVVGKGACDVWIEEHEIRTVLITVRVLPSDPALE